MSTEPKIPDEELDASPYIRTYAQDFAALSGKNPEESGMADKKKDSSRKEKPEKKSKTKKSKKGDRSLIAPPEPKTRPADFSEIELNDEGMEQQVQNNLQEMTTAAKDAETISLPRIAPGDIVTQEETITDSQPGPQDILARLKTQALKNKDLGHDLEPIIPIAPVAIPSVTPSAPVPAAIEKITNDEAPSNLHTYTSDFEDHLQEEHASPFSVIAAEKDAPSPKPVAQKKNSTNFLPVVAGVFLLLIGIGAVSAAYIYMSKNAPVVSIPLSPSLINPDSRIQLSGTGSGLLQALAQQAIQPLANNDVLLTYVNESTTTQQGVVEEPASGGAFIAELNLQAPDILLRNIASESMVGIVSAGGETRPFFILRVDSYERTFSGMLAWEPTMFAQLSVLYPQYPAPIVPTQPVPSTTVQQNSATSTATTSKTSVTPEIITAQTTSSINTNRPAAQFIDETVSSHDVRALKDNSGRTLVLYGYADKQTLIIARNESAFTLLLSRLESATN